MENEKTIEFSNRTFIDGNFFYIPSIDTEYLHQISSTFPLALCQTVLAVIELADSIDSEFTLSCRFIANHLNITTVTLNKRLRRLVALDVLKPRKFKFTNSESMRISCFELCTNAIEILEPKEEPIKSKPSSNEIRKITASRRELEKSIYKENFAPRPKTDDVLPIRQPGNFLVEQCMSIAKYPVTQMAKTVQLGNRTEVQAKITSNTRIMTPEDLQVLFAVYSLIHAYHENHTSLDQTPINRTPIHIADIAAVRGKTIGGTTSAKLRESLESIYQTSFEFYGLGNLDLNNFSICSYMRERFTNFVQCSPLSEIEAEIKGNDISFGSDSMIYVIKLPDDVFNQLIMGKYHFVFPQASLSAPGVVFSLYLRLRSRTKNKKYSESLRLTWVEIAKGTEFNDFKISLRTQLLKINRKLKNVDDPFSSATYDKESNRLNFNLWGYHGYICFNENIICSQLHEDEMYAACRIGSNSYVRNAPTVENHLHKFYSANLKIESSLPKNISKLVKSKINRYDITYLLKNNDTLSLCLYRTEYEYERIIELIAEDYHLEPWTVSKKVEHDLSQIQPVTIKDRTITQSDFNAIIELFGLYHVPTHLITKFLWTYKSIHLDLISALDGNEPSDKLLDKFESMDW
ncbi:replication initiator protein RctB domain-containing protein [Photobacterium damselae]|uniref:replication initiator protein RctB domain-containing protein n=2 Tax=Photobacterium damselae TaxID=38293 RepID=UPI000D6606F1|nr:replication initiator protein RctB domain-containing protein [Photobacterium damselae]AWK84587.1 hypothetical protein BST98_21405 [Photobacterium damselae]MCG3823103.1 DUF3346 domain-containing protein [Photobacterium damselae]NVO60608.1 DUF3346 domain-containing protein [Photobacterium damselae subsp. damselae]TLS85876.1 DUF3346 domain-containing protein [Photobacterium damselae subsp. damselae]WIH21873.1 DUF3346 domain-containing protein [Photobacterium damselae]